jgi:RNA polymerase sigma-70 factor (ECF subfamily)
VIDVEAVYRAESGRVLATLIRLLGGFDLAEDALQDAFVAAARSWPVEGLPREPRAWLVSAGRFAAVSRLRRRARFDRLLERRAHELEREPVDLAPRTLDQDRLRLIFTCCHPALGRDAQLALTLREVCGLSTEQIAAAFLQSPSAIAQRIVRTKRKIAVERIPYEVPAAAEVGERLAPVLHVIYLVFNEGYAASSGPALSRPELCAQAIGLARSLAELLPSGDTLGLLALLLLIDARRAARQTDAGDFVLLAEQDREMWDRGQIAEGLDLVRRAWDLQPLGAYTIQAKIAAVHASARTPAATDWRQIVQLYGLLLVADPSPLVELNRAVAVAELRGPEAGLALIEPLLQGAELRSYRFAHAAHADLLRRAGRGAEAAEAYRRALDLTTAEPERRFIQQRLEEVTC